MSRATSQPSLLTLITLSALASACAGNGPQPTTLPSPTPSTSASTSQVALPPSSTEAPPLGKLSDDVTPTHYALTLEVDPELARFSGHVSIDVTIASPRPVIWFHGRNLHVSSASITPQGGAKVAAAYEEVHPSGIAALRPEKQVPAGTARIELEFDAAFPTQLRGLYQVKVKPREGGAPLGYAFTQFEAISARHAFPGFDEPRFKTPFDVTLKVPKGDVAIANTNERARVDEGGKTAVTFVTTQPLPTYLLAWAVGPLDVVEGKSVAPFGDRKAPLKIRGIAAKGRGPELAYALAHTGELVSTIEGYTGVAYPFDKLDVLAVPDRDGAMENPGAITFNDFLLLVDEKTAPVNQKRAFASVMAHELAHIWFGDLVTHAWWDDIWLNEAFATWMGTKAHALWDPHSHADLFLLGRIQDAMGTDALVSARKIRQPIESSHDIQNAFDGITYQKGAGVLSMFERWIGPKVFQESIHKYLMDHRFGSATSKDFLASLPEKARAPFETFLEQPGVPFVSATLTCEGKPRLSLHQSRHFPLGSKGNVDQTWQIPICARYGLAKDGKDAKETCTLLSAKDGELPFEGDKCPSWVMPNAEASGYFRFGLAEKDLRALTSSFGKLTTAERFAFADSLWAGYSRGTSSAKSVATALEPFAKEHFPSLATQPMSILWQGRDWFWDELPLRAKVEALGRKLYAAPMKELGFVTKPGEDPERTTLRASVIGYLAMSAGDEATRKEAKKRGLAYVGYGADGKLHPEAVDSNWAGVALGVAMEDGDAKLFDAVLALLATTDDSVVRGRLIDALGRVKDPKLAERARALSLDPVLKVSEALWPLYAQLDSRDSRDDAWNWLLAHFDDLVARISPERAGGLPWIAARFCDEAHATAAEKFFTPRIAKLEGGPRNLAGALERIELCLVKRKKQEASLREYFEKK